jgi:hypothetical protein
VANTGVVYLYRFAEGEEPAVRFLDSYGRHPAGFEHDLHVVLKGFPNEGALRSARALFRALPINTIEVGDSGYDIGSYFAAARAVSNRQLMFLNTFSEILADNWLAHLDKALSMPGVGLVGATGSWQSVCSSYEAALFRVLNRLKAFGGSINRREQLPVTVDHRGTSQGVYQRVDIRQVLRNLARAGLYPLRLYEFGRHPNPHIRSNAFMIRRDVFLSLRRPAFDKKIDAYKFESGRQSMTKQVIARDLRPVVVDRCGRVYGVSEWKSSSTFWIDMQHNLLVADNQTNNYAAGSSERRAVLENHAWESPRFWNIAHPFNRTDA